MSRGILSPRQRQALADGVRAHDNILIGGGTGSGKTTFANALVKVSRCLPRARKHRLTESVSPHPLSEVTMSNAKVLDLKEKALPSLPGDDRDAAKRDPPPARPIDRAALSDDQVLAAIADEARGDLTRRMARREDEFFECVSAHALVRSISPKRLRAEVTKRMLQSSNAIGERDRRRDVKPTYFNPQNPSRTWSGSGGTPQWDADYLAGGGREADLLISEAAGSADAVKKPSR